MTEEKKERKWNYLLFRDDVEGPDVARELMAEEIVERKWIRVKTSAPRHKNTVIIFSNRIFQSSRNGLE